MAALKSVHDAYHLSVVMLFCMPRFPALFAFAASLQKGQQYDDAAEEDFLPHCIVHWEFSIVRTCSILKRHLKKLMMC